MVKPFDPPTQNTMKGMDNTWTGPDQRSILQERKLFTHNKLMHTQLTLIVAAVNTM